MSLDPPISIAITFFVIVFVVLCARICCCKLPVQPKPPQIHYVLRIRFQVMYELTPTLPILSVILVIFAFLFYRVARHKVIPEPRVVRTGGIYILDDTAMSPMARETRRIRTASINHTVIRVEDDPPPPYEEAIKIERF